MRKPPPVPTLKDLEWARRTFEEEEPRGLFYKAASDLVERAIRGESTLSLSEAVAVLLQTWNAQYYRFRGGFTAERYDEIDALFQKHLGELLALRPLTIETAANDELDQAMRIFGEFEVNLGATGRLQVSAPASPRGCSRSGRTQSRRLTASTQLTPPT